jgi:hypothetical protein
MITSVREPADSLREVNLASCVEEIVFATAADDIHTHLSDPGAKGMLLWGIDELLVYHYLISEGFRYFDLPFEQFWRLSLREQGELIWRHLFLDHSPVSEACRGVVTTLNRLGLEVEKRDLKNVRQWFARRNLEEHVTACMELAGVRTICMTNSPFDPQEKEAWEKGWRRDERFVAGLRLDPLLLSWEETGPLLREWGYEVSTGLGEKCRSELRRFLEDWTRRISPRYLMTSFSPEFAYPGTDVRSLLLEKVLLPFCREHGLPFALMLGVRRGMNPGLKLAGDGVGVSDLQNLARLCAAFPDNKFITTVLARENQHELCVLARKFRNLHPFGCWWFTNTPALFEEITRMRLELLGLSFTAQHSDARVLEQIVYKWQHTRSALSKVLIENYRLLEEAGWTVSSEEIQRDVSHLLGGAFQAFCSR